MSGGVECEYGLAAATCCRLPVVLMFSHRLLRGLCSFFGSAETLKVLKNTGLNSLLLPVVVYCHIACALSWPQVVDNERGYIFFNDSHIKYITEKKKKKIGMLASYYFRLLKSTSGKWMGFFCAESWFCTKIPKCMCLWVCMWFTHLLHCYALLFYVCVRMCSSFALHWESRAALFLCLTFLINILLPLFLFSPLSLSLSWASEWGFIYAPPHTIEGLAGWNPVGMIWVASGAVKKLPPPDGCKQSFCYLFLTFIYPQ